jgi:hypothetical protein
MLGDAIKSGENEAQTNSLTQLFLKSLMEKCEKLNPDLDKLPRDKYLNESLRGEV